MRIYRTAVWSLYVASLIGLLITAIFGLTGSTGVALVAFCATIVSLIPLITMGALSTIRLYGLVREATDANECAIALDRVKREVDTLSSFVGQQSIKESDVRELSVEVKRLAEGDTVSLADLNSERQKWEETSQRLVTQSGKSSKLVARSLESFSESTEQKLTHVINRVTEAERRLLATYDTASLEHGDLLRRIEGGLSPSGSPSAQDSPTESARTAKSSTANVTTAIETLAVRVEELHRRMEEMLVLEVSREGTKTRSQLDQSSTSTVRQMESLLQLLPRMSQAGRGLPPTGGWAMSAEGLLLVSDLIQSRKPKKILELGSGSSTIWIGLQASEIGASLISVEHDEAYAQKTQRLITEFGLTESVELRLAELTDVTLSDRQTRWYDPEALERLEQVDMLIVDGPPGATGPQARQPALPMLIDTLSADCVVLLDDMHRTSEKHAFETWEECYSDFTRQDSGSARVGVLERSKSKRN